MKINDENKELLNGVQLQIGSFDNKASLLLSIVGIVFALALTFLDVFHSEFFKLQSNVYILLYKIIFCLFIFFTIATIFCFVMVIIPRVNKTNKLYPNYYRDIAKMDKEELQNKIKEWKSSNDLIIDQISINAKICDKKHKWLKMGVFLLVPFVLIIIILSLMIAFI